MGYQKPPLIDAQDINLVAGTTSATLIAAPGANKRLRIVGGVVSLSRLSTALANFALLDGAGGSILWSSQGHSVAGNPTSPINIPEPGLHLTINTLLEAQITGSAASSSARFITYYYIDNV